jgi:hypothetical protein
MISDILLFLRVFSHGREYFLLFYNAFKGKESDMHHDCKTNIFNQNKVKYDIMTETFFF